MTYVSAPSFTVPAEVDPVILSVASTVLSSQGWGTPTNTDTPLEWDLTNNDSQIRIMHDVVLDILKAVARLEPTFGPTLIDDLIRTARRYVQLEQEQQLADVNADIHAELRDGGQPYNRDAKGEEKSWEKESTS